MKAYLLSGSRNHKGQTAQAIQALEKGLASAGVETSTDFLPDYELERCRQCDDNGWGLCRQSGHCVIADDFEILFQNLRVADVVVFATPVYYGDLSESMRAFTDRLRRVCTVEAVRLGLQGKPAVGICVAGGGGGGSAECCVSLNKVLSNCGVDVVDLVPVRRQNLAMKLETLEIIGKWLATRPQSR